MEIGRNMTTDGLREAAFQTYFVEKTRQPADPENSTFERRFGRPQRNPFLGWNPSPHLISSYVFQGALMDGDFRGLFTSEGFLPGTGYLVSDEDMKGIEISRELVRKVSAVPPVIVGCNTAHRNYFHWVTQALPAIDWCSKRNGPGAVVALPPLNAWQKESIMLLGHDELNIVTIEDCSKLYEFEYLEYCNILSGQASFSLSRTVSDTYSRLRQKICNSPLATRKIYVGRTDAEARRMRNEAELIEHLRKLDFEIVVPGNLSVAEQIQVFGEAALVVGPHGAGMTNIAFCKPGTIVYELLPSHYGNACFCNLARICDLAYWADSFESDGHGLPNLRDWESNTKEIMERLTEIDSVGKYFKIYQETGAAKEVLSRIPLPQPFSRQCLTAARSIRQF
jgi:hypothetical protein